GGGGDLGSHTEGPPLRRGLEESTAALSREFKKRASGGPFLVGSPKRGAPCSRLSRTMGLREPAAWAAETDGARSLKGGRCGRPSRFPLRQGPRFFTVPEPCQRASSSAYELYAAELQSGTKTKERNGQRNGSPDRA